MHRNAFHDQEAQYSVTSRFECRAVVLKHEYALSHHHPYVGQQKGGTAIAPVLRTHVFQSCLKLPGSAHQSDHRVLTRR